MKNTFVLILTTAALISCAQPSPEANSGRVDTSIVNATEDEVGKEDHIAQKEENEPENTPKTTLCDAYSLNFLDTIIPGESDISQEEQISEEMEMCKLNFAQGSLKTTHFTTVPNAYEGDANAYLRSIFASYSGGYQPRLGFEKLEDLDFTAGWTSDKNKFFGNTLDFVVDNERYSITVNIPELSNAERKSAAIKMAHELAN